MKNSKLRNSLIAAGIAVLAGVLVLGINAAVGDAPGYDPPGTGISPIFTGLGVMEDAVIANDLVVGNNLVVLGDGSRIDGDLEVDGTLEVLETLVVNGFYGIRTSTPTDPDPVKIDDDLDVIGNVQLGTGSMFGSVYRISSWTSGVWSYTDSCYVDDILLSCGGWSISGLRGLSPSVTSCTVIPISTTDIVWAYLTCLDPEGIRTE